MSMAPLNPDTIPVILRSIGKPLKGDAELHLLAEMPFRIPDLVPTAVVSTAATTAGYTSQEATSLVAAINKRKGGK